MTLSASADVSSTNYWLRVALNVPLRGLFDYRSEQTVAVGQRVIVPFGRRKLIGVVIETPDQPHFPPEQIKAVDQVLDDLPPFSDDWMRLARFAATYYHRSLGEVILPSLPTHLRRVGSYQGKRSGAGPVARYDKRQQAADAKEQEAEQAREAEETTEVKEARAAEKTSGTKEVKGSISDFVKSANVDEAHLNSEQEYAVEQVRESQGFAPFLLYGITGSGKTEVYLRLARHYLALGKQVLFMTPEINLTPQLQLLLHKRFADLAQSQQLAVLHSGLSDGQRLDAWLRTSRGEAKVLLGTRLSIFTPMPDLGLIIVDEEHDASYKQQESLRYSARDLAIWRAHDLKIPVVLGSATPSLETWRHAQRGHYQQLTLSKRARPVSLPSIRLLDIRREKLEQGFSPRLLQAIQERLDKNEQSLIFLNRRGFAPVLRCHSCAWVSRCVRCTTFVVMHQAGSCNYLQCHHCGYQSRVPPACPDCGDQDLQPMGRGTQRVEDFLAQTFPQARVLRIDADSTRRKGQAEALFAKVYSGEVDILVGTQMVAKGHDFANLGLVGILNTDAMLFSQDFRAPERLFAQLVQVAGRAGRHTEAADVLVQTEYPDQAVYQAVCQHDYPGFANYALEERKAVGLPPYAYQALLSAQARALKQTIEFLSLARDLPLEQPDNYPSFDAIFIYDPVPLRIVRVANIERAQLLVESANRAALQSFLNQWLPQLEPLAKKTRVRYYLEVDPLEI